MFFVRMGKLLAVLAFGWGVLKTAFGIMLAIDDNQELARRYFFAENTGEVIDKGLQVILFGVVMGILCHIADSVSREAPNKGGSDTPAPSPRSYSSF